MRLATLLFALIVGSGAAQAQQTFCQAGAVADYPAVGAAPRISILHDGELTQWRPPSCAGWVATSHAKLVVTLAGTFKFQGTMDDLVARVGETSRLATIPYWSTEDKTWKPLANAASALSSANSTDRRGDFSSAELKTGAHLYYWEDDSLTGQTVYELTVYEKSADRAVIGTHNVSPTRRSIFTLFRPGASRSALFLQRVSPGIFRASIVATAMDGTSSLVLGHEQVYVDRAKALFAFLAAGKPEQQQLALAASATN